MVFLPFYLQITYNLYYLCVRNGKRPIAHGIKTAAMPSQKKENK